MKGLLGEQQVKTSAGTRARKNERVQHMSDDPSGAWKRATAGVDSGAVGEEGTSKLNTPSSPLGRATQPTLRLSSLVVLIGTIKACLLDP